MRHRFGWSRLGRDAIHRRALLKNMVTSLIKHERIVTTMAKAKEIRRTGDQIITLGKKGTPHAKQKAWYWMRESNLVGKLFGPLRQRYLTRPGGYTRVLRAPNRRGDNAPMAVVELVGNRFPPLEPARTGKKIKIFTTAKKSVHQTPKTTPVKNSTKLLTNSEKHVPKETVVAKSGHRHTRDSTRKNISQREVRATPVDGTAV